MKCTNPNQECDGTMQLAAWTSWTKQECDKCGFRVELAPGGLVKDTKKTKADKAIAGQEKPNELKEN